MASRTKTNESGCDKPRSEGEGPGVVQLKTGTEELRRVLPQGRSRVPERSACGNSGQPSRAHPCNDKKKPEQEKSRAGVTSPSCVRPRRSNKEPESMQLDVSGTKPIRETPCNSRGEPRSQVPGAGTLGPAQQLPKTSRKELGRAVDRKNRKGSDVAASSANDTNPRHATPCRNGNNPELVAEHRDSTNPSSNILTLSIEPACTEDCTGKGDSGSAASGANRSGPSCAAPRSRRELSG